MYYVHENELDSLASDLSSLHGTFFGIAVGAAIGFAIALPTPSLSDRMFTVFAVSLGVSLLASVYFGIRTALDRKASQAKLLKIKGKKV